MRRTRAGWAAGLAAAVLAAAGCGGGDGTAEVSGEVKFNGQPVGEGAITFTPADGKAPTAGGAVKDGRYSARVPVGTAKVSISSPKVVGKKKVYNTPDSPEMPITEEALPAKYNTKTELTLDVKPGQNPKDFDLVGK